MAGIKKPAASKETRGPIEPDVIYPLPDIKQRSGFGDHAMRQARRAGLKVRYKSNRAFKVQRPITPKDRV